MESPTCEKCIYYINPMRCKFDNNFIILNTPYSTSYCNRYTEAIDNIEVAEIQQPKDCENNDSTTI